MGLMNWFNDPLGLKALSADYAAERALRESLLRDILAITQIQSESVRVMAESFERMSRGFEHDGLPLERGSGHVEEYVLWEAPSGAES